MGAGPLELRLLRCRVPAAPRGGDEHLDRPGMPPPLRDKNSVGRYTFWGVPGPMLGVVTTHIAASGPPLFAPPPHS